MHTVYVYAMYRVSCHHCDTRHGDNGIGRIYWNIHNLLVPAQTSLPAVTGKGRGKEGRGGEGREGRKICTTHQVKHEMAHTLLHYMRQ